MKNKKLDLRDIIITLMGIAIIILFIFIIQLNNKLDNKKITNTTNSSSTAEKPNNTQTLPTTKIAFINIDTINEKYLYISDYVNTMKKKKDALEAQLQSMMMKFQEDYEAFQQSVQAGIAPQAELEKQKRKLEQQQKDIQNKQLQMDKLALELQEKNEQLQKDIKDFLKKFNNSNYDYILSYSEILPNVLLANPQYDITNEVLNELNKEYLTKKQNSK